MDSESKSTEEYLHLLPEGIFEEILVKLPVKSLSRLRCVSKSWLSLIDSKRFIKFHLEYSAKNTDSAHHRVIIFPLSKPWQAKQCSLRALLERTDLSTTLFHPISQATPCYSNCCNGVVCTYEPWLGRFLLLNPTTGVSKELPKDPEIDNSKGGAYLLKFGFGWDESSGAYKVIAGWSVPVWLKGRIYSSNTNSWKTIEDDQVYSYSHDSICVGGKIHWLSFRTNSVTISSFDVQSEKFGTIEPPRQAETKGEFMALLGVVGDCLCFSVQYYQDPKKAFHVWVMKEESWEKLHTIHLLQETRPYARVIGEGASGEILIAHCWDLIVYSPRNGVIRHLTETGCAFRAHLYVESLVSPLSLITSTDS